MNLALMRAVIGAALLATTLATPSAAAPEHAPAPGTPVNRHTLNAVSEQFELVIANDPLRPGKISRLDFYLSDFATNEPLPGARLEVAYRARGGDGPLWSGQAEATPSPGTYSAPWPAADTGAYVVFVTLEARGRRGEFALAGLEVAAATADPAAASASTESRASRWAWWLAVIPIALMVGWLARRRSAPALLAIGLLAQLPPGPWAAGEAHAHEGHDDATTLAPGAPLGPGAVVQLPKPSQFLIGVRTRPVRFAPVRPQISVLGRVAPRGGAALEMTAPQGGRVQFDGGRTPVIGQRLRAGERIGELLVVDALPLRAAIGGVVTEVFVVHGQAVQPGQKLLALLDPAVVWVHADIFQADLAHVARSTRAHVTSGSAPERVFEGRRVAIGATEGEVPGAVEAWFEVPNPGGALRVGAVAEVAIEYGEPQSLATLPREALHERQGRTYVFVHTAPERFAAREVSVVSRLGDQVAVRGSLLPGDRVAISGVAALAASPVVALEH
ncbi:MAG: HlyD family efflux transporter periplasmic adaptor subunit [Candidatus Eisenbacteria bacterium]|uniref:HlyD family efflux transporter periplasmic adaptor subunit n=1 Tax=Eiseniibacteriota bacterium TaxID=2212470 RepID=A0A849SLM8_UNCEI|nr:HlyD family efflux transporter periplasmic adaptor subunit [Candidatus Eisenbacteria bacterium]